MSIELQFEPCDIIIFDSIGVIFKLRTILFFVVTQSLFTIVTQSKEEIATVVDIEAHTPRKNEVERRSSKVVE